MCDSLHVFHPTANEFTLSLFDSSTSSFNMAAIFLSTVLFKPTSDFRQGGGGGGSVLKSWTYMDTIVLSGKNAQPTTLLKILVF